MRSIKLFALTVIGLHLVGVNPLLAEMDIWGKGEVPRITDPKDVPQTLPAMWKGYDESYDKNNPLETKILKTWETPEGIVANWVQITVGTFQGEKAIICGFWTYPKGGKNLPAILNTNGGGQGASLGAALYYSYLGYACFNPNNDKTEKLIHQPEIVGLQNTDWGALDDELHNGKEMAFNATDQTIDAVPSPRNSRNFLRHMAARRVITFMTEQPQVNPKKIGIAGFSTGGSSTVCESIDPRVTAAVPHCGGCGGKMDVDKIITGNASSLNPEFEKSYGKVYREFDEGGFWKYMKAPVLLLAASNDFHCPDWNSVQAIQAVPAGVDKRYVLGANYNHASPPEVLVADYLWFQDKLKGEFKFPETPKGELLLQQPDGIPIFKVTLPKTELKFKHIDMFYTDGRNPLHRFWITGKPSKNADGTWQIKCPAFYADEPLFAFANAVYEIAPIKAPHTPYNGLSEMAVSSNYSWAWPENLQAAKVKPQATSNRLIDDFSNGGRDWLGGNLNSGEMWSITTRKVSSPFFMGPKGGELVFEINSPEAGAKVVVEVQRAFLDPNTRKDTFYGFFDLPVQGWNTVHVKASDLHNPYGWQLDDWHKLNTLALRAPQGVKERLEKEMSKKVGSGNQSGGQPPTGNLPDKVSGWNESYYKSASDEYTKGAVLNPTDVFIKTHFRNMRWEGGEFVPRSKPYVDEPFVKPTEPK